MHSSDSEQDSVVGFCEHGNNPSCSIQGRGRHFLTNSMDISVSRGALVHWVSQLSF
jgi:hypothetical protein